MQSVDQHGINAENHTQVPYHTHFNDTVTEYPAWSTDTNDIENTNEAQYRENRQDILNTWQTDTPVKTPYNRQVLDNIEAYTQDRLNIIQSLNHRLGLRKSSLLGAQPVTVAMMQSHQLTTNISTHVSNSIATDQQDDSDYQDDREEELFQVDGTMDVQTPTDNSDDNEDNEPDNTACKRQRKMYAAADTVRKEMTKKRQADLLKKQQEKDKVKAQAEASKDKPDNTNRPRAHKSKSKASHHDQIKSSEKDRRTANDNMLPHDTQSDGVTQDEDILIGDEDIVPDDAEEPLGPDKIGFYTFFLEGQGNPPDLMGVNDD